MAKSVISLGISDLEFFICECNKEEMGEMNNDGSSLLMLRIAIYLNEPEIKVFFPHPYM